MVQRPSSESVRSSTKQKLAAHFMEPEGSLPHSQEPATYPHLEPEQFMPSIPILEIYFSIILILPVL